MTLEAVAGERSSKFSQVKLYLHGFDKATKIELAGEGQTLKQETVEFLPPISNFDPVDITVYLDTRGGTILPVEEESQPHETRFGP